MYNFVNKYKKPSYPCLSSRLDLEILTQIGKKNLDEIEKKAGYIPYTCYCAKKSFIDENPDLIQDFTNAVYTGMIWVQEHTAEEVAQVIAPQFPDSDTSLLTTVVQRYKDQDTWRPDPVLTEEGFNHLMEIIN